MNYTYTPYYPGGWQDSPNTTTPIIAAALQNIENGLILATGALDAQLVKPSGDTSGATDPSNVQAVISSYGVAVLAPGSWYGNATVIGHEAQWVYCLPGVDWKLKATGIPAFLWTPANPASYSQTGTGGIRGRPLIIGPGSVTNPSDGSIAVQMGDIVQLVSDFQHQNCQYGLLLSNQNFWTEQGEHRVFSAGRTKNPFIAQCAASGGSSRTGSFDRTRVTVYHDEWLDGSVGGTPFGLGGVQVLAGAQFDGGSIRQFGNFSGIGQSGVYALYTSGACPAGSATPGNPSSLFGCDAIAANLEYDGSGTPPGTIFQGAGTYIERCSGNLRYYGFGPSSIDATADFDFTGPITGDVTLQSASAAAPISVSPSASGWGGNFIFIYGYRANLQFIQGEATIPAAFTISTGTTLATAIPAPFKPLSNKMVMMQVYDNATGVVTPIPCIISTAGHLIAQNGTSLTLGASGGGMYGGGMYSAGF